MSCDNLKYEYERALKKVKEYQAQLQALFDQAATGTMSQRAFASARDNLQANINQWTLTANAKNRAFIECMKSGGTSDQTQKAEDEAREQEQDATDTENAPPFDPLTSDQLELAKKSIEDFYMNQVWGGKLTMDEALDAIQIAIYNLESGKTYEEAVARGDEQIEELRGLPADEKTQSILNKFGNLGALMSNRDIGMNVAGFVNSFMSFVGLTPEALEGLKGSTVNRERAAQFATAASAAMQTGLGILYSVGVVAEVASLGQIETIIDAIDNVVKNVGIDEILKPIFTAPFDAALKIPTQQYWMKQFRPFIPEFEVLRQIAIKEGWPVDTREEQFEEMRKWAAYHGLGDEWMEPLLKAGYQRMDVRTAIMNYWWGNWDETRLKGFLSIADIHPDDHKAIMDTIYRPPGRFERRHGFIMGVYDRTDLETQFRREGLSPQDAGTATEAMALYALRATRNAVARAAGRIYREGVKDSTGIVNQAILLARKKMQDAEWTADQVADFMDQSRGVAAGVLKKHDAAFREELSNLMIMREEADLWVRRYYLESFIEVPPYEEAFEEGGEPVAPGPAEPVIPIIPIEEPIITPPGTEPEGDIYFSWDFEGGDIEEVSKDDGGRIEHKSPNLVKIDSNAHRGSHGMKADIDDPRVETFGGTTRAEIARWRMGDGKTRLPSLTRGFFGWMIYITRAQFDIDPDQGWEPVIAQLHVSGDWKKDYFFALRVRSRGDTLEWFLRSKLVERDGRRRQRDYNFTDNVIPLNRFNKVIIEADLTLNGGLKLWINDSFKGEWSENLSTPSDEPGPTMKAGIYQALGDVKRSVFYDNLIAASNYETASYWMDQPTIPRYKLGGVTL